MLRSHNGSALITGMIAALSVGVVSAIILQQSQVTEKQTRIPRVKSSMMMVETQLNEALNQSVIVQPCASKVPGCLEINDEALDKMAVEIPGAVCSTPPCGVSIQNRSLSGNQFTARIVYNGTEVSIAPVNVTLSIQQNEAWLAANSSCPATQPLLVGFNSDGSRICRSLPANCGPGMYISNVDPMSLTSGGVTCTNFPANVACPANQIMIGFRWVGGPTGFTPQCANFLNPFDPTVLNDPTNYAYAPPITPVLTGWPTTTTTMTGAGCPSGETWQLVQSNDEYGAFMVCSFPTCSFVSSNLAGTALPWPSGDAMHRCVKASGSAYNICCVNGGACTGVLVDRYACVGSPTTTTTTTLPFMGGCHCEYWNIGAYKPAYFVGTLAECNNMKAIHYPGNPKITCAPSMSQTPINPGCEYTLADLTSPNLVMNPYPCLPYETTTTTTVPYTWKKDRFVPACGCYAPYANTTKISADEGKPCSTLNAIKVDSTGWGNANSAACGTPAPCELLLICK